MAVAIRTTNLPAGVGTEGYDAVSAELDLSGSPPEGLLFHWAGEIDGEWTITDVWESREAYDRFERDLLVPAITKVTGSVPEGRATVDEFPVHDYVKP
jgi:hypothetical protein